MKRQNERPYLLSPKARILASEPRDAPPPSRRSTVGVRMGRCVNGAIQ